jgi:hypothetical protein
MTIAQQSAVNHIQSCFPDKVIKVMESDKSGIVYYWIGYSSGDIDKTGHIHAN